MTAGEFCNRWVVFIDADEPVAIAAERMREHHVGALVVIEEREGKRYPIGILTDRDLVLEALARGVQNLEVIAARHFITGALVSASESESLFDVMRRMRAFGVRRLPVVDEEGVLEGIITFDDVVAYVADELGQLARLLANEQAHEVDRVEGHA